MPHNPEHLSRAKEILSELDAENISSDKYHPLLTKTRSLCLGMASGMQAPGLTSCVATTLCGVGLCQELGQRFVLEYCLKYSEQNVGLVFLRDNGKEIMCLPILARQKFPMICSLAGAEKPQH